MVGVSGALGVLPSVKEKERLMLKVIVQDVLRNILKNYWHGARDDSLTKVLPKQNLMSFGLEPLTLLDVNRYLRWVSHTTKNAF